MQFMKLILVQKKELVA